MEEYKYLFSVITTIYNTEKYLEECIESVINQTIGFENIQLILINNGSTDSSGEICLRYKNKYPDNVVYEKKQHGSIGTGRNAGYKYIEGKYVSILDSDDLFLLTVCEKAYSYFESNYEKINIVRGNLIMFTDEEDLRKISIDEDVKPKTLDIRVDRLPLNSSFQGAFFKKSIFVKYYFDENCTYSGDDIKLLNIILLNEVIYGDLNAVTHLYRAKRKGSLTRCMHSYNAREYVFKYINKIVFETLINISLLIYGEVLKHIQWLFVKYLSLYLSLKPIEIYMNKFLNDARELMKFVEYDATMPEDILHILVYIEKRCKTLDNDLIIIDRKLLEQKVIMSDKKRYINCTILNSNIFQNTNNQTILKIKGCLEIIKFYKMNNIYFKIDQRLFLAEIFNKEVIVQMHEFEISSRYDFFINLNYYDCKNKIIEIYLDIDGELIFCPPLLKF